MTLPLIAAARLKAVLINRREVYKTPRKTILRSVLIIWGLVCFFPNEAPAVAFTVNTTGDTIVVDACFLPPSPGCSLRGAIAAANSNAGSDVIEFDIPASEPACSAAGVCTINIPQSLPAISTAVFRPSTATWFVQRSLSGIMLQQFGSDDDLPAPGAFVP